MDQVVFEGEIEPEQSDQVGGMGNGPQLGCGRSHPQSKHALHQAFGVLHFFHGFTSKPGSRITITPDLH